MSKLQKNIIGLQFNRLTVLSYEPPATAKNGNKIKKIKCECVCGVIKDYSLFKVLSGHTKSCGCLAHKWLNKTNIVGTKIEYKVLQAVWRSMVHRCCNSKSTYYRDYGGRGIGVCNEWRYDFINFYEWAIKNGYKEGLEIDRRDNDSSYSPNNCRFCTRGQNNRNTRQNIHITYKGETRILKEWAEYLGIGYKLLHGRLYNGWEFEDAININLQTAGRKVIDIETNKLYKSIRICANEIGISYPRLHKMLSGGLFNKTAIRYYPATE